MIPRLIRSTSLALAIAILVAPASTFADVLILKSGDEIHGRFANRQMLRVDPFALKRVTIDAGTGGAVDLQSYPFAEVQYLVFEEDDGTRDIIDPWNVKDAARPGGTHTVSEGWPPHEQVQASGDHGVLGAIVAMGLGVAGVVVGSVHKFGDEELVVTQSEIKSEKQYNATNWILIGFGSTLVVFGTYSLIQALRTPARPMFGWNDDGGVLVGVTTPF